MRLLRYEILLTVPEDLLLALIVALDTRDAPALCALIRERPALAERLDAPLPGGEDTPLVWAVDQGERALATILLDAGADVNAGAGGITPLHKAAWNDDVEMIGFLVGRGADLARRDARFGTDPLGWAAFNRSQRAIDALLAGRLVENVSQAASFGRMALVQAMIDADPSRIEGDGDGFSPLRSAAWYGYPALVRWLLDAGADLHATNAASQNAFSLARERRHREVTRILLAAGATWPEPAAPEPAAPEPAAPEPIAAEIPIEG